jgi:RimJ/RimL family protein N-acetyltransferase
VDETTAIGLEYLRLITRLANRVRIEDPTAGIWEAADFQWWWRRERASDEIAQPFWTDASGAPEAAAVVFTDWSTAWGCDLVVLPSRAQDLLPEVWSSALERIDDMSLEDVGVTVRNDDATLLELVLESGFSASDESFFVETWLELAHAPPIGELAEGFGLFDRLDHLDRPHHMISRNGDRVAERLSQTSLYRPDLDLWVEDVEGRVAAYGLFWLDPVTGVGLVEPMRTEEMYWRRGLARHVLTAGLSRLASLGATRAKVSYESANPAAKDLYIGSGFQGQSSSREYRRRKRT